jgi:hypothetical protein
MVPCLEFIGKILKRRCMKRKIYLTALGMTMFLGLTQGSYADPLLPVVAGGASVTYSFTSSSNSAVHVLATYTLSADGRSLRVDVQNHSQELGIGQILIQIRESWMPSHSYITPPPPGLFFPQVAPSPRPNLVGVSGKVSFQSQF